LYSYRKGCSYSAAILLEEQNNLFSNRQACRFFPFCLAFVIFLLEQG
jgi:hypothetical protein